MKEIKKLLPPINNIYDWMDIYNDLRKEAGIREITYDEIIEESVWHYLSEQLIEIKSLLYNK